MNRLMFLLLAAPAAADPRPVPDPAEIKEALTSYRVAYKEEYAAATTRSAKLALAVRLRDEADDFGTAATEYVGLTEAARLAAGAGDAAFTLECYNRLEARFRLKGAAKPLLVKLAQTLAQAGSTDKDAAATFVGVLRRLAEEAVKRARFADAVEWLTLAGPLAERSGDPPLIARCRELRERAVRYKADAAKLKASPDDSGANAAMAAFHLHERHDWEAALPHLVKSGDKGVAAAARADLADPDDAAGRTKIGRTWESLAARADASDRKAYRGRAAEWYQYALAVAEGGDSLIAKVRLRRLSGDGAAGPLLKGHSGAVYGVAFSPDGRAVATASGDETVRLWDADGNHLRTLEGHSGDVNTVAYSPDGRFIASGSSDKTVRVWDAASGLQLGALIGHSFNVNGVAYSPDGRVITTASGDKTLRGWDATTGRHLATFFGHTEWVGGVAYSPDGRSIVSVSGDKTVRVLAAAGQHRRTLFGHTDSVTGVAYSPDGRLIASGSSDKTVRVWDAASGKRLRTFAGHSMWVYGVAFSPDGRLIASASGDKTVRVWDAASGKPLGILGGHSNYVFGVAFSPDGRFIASGSKDNTARLWPVSSLWSRR